MRPSGLSTAGVCFVCAGLSRPYGLSHSKEDAARIERDANLEGLQNMVRHMRIRHLVQQIEERSHLSVKAFSACELDRRPRSLLLVEGAGGKVDLAGYTVDDLSRRSGPHDERIV